MEKNLRMKRNEMVEESGEMKYKIKKELISEIWRESGDWMRMIYYNNDKRLAYSTHTTIWIW